MRDGQSNVSSYVSGHDPRRTANILNHIGATNVRAGLVRERNAYRIVFLKNDTSIPFIAGDQPVLNMLDAKATDDVELYYPLSPRLAMKAYPFASGDTIRRGMAADLAPFPYRILIAPEVTE